MARSTFVEAHRSSVRWLAEGPLQPEVAAGDRLRRSAGPVPDGQSAVEDEDGSEFLGVSTALLIAAGTNEQPAASPTAGVTVLILAGHSYGSSVIAVAGNTFSGEIT